MRRLFFLFLLITTSCISSKDGEAILDGSNCILPCWNNIVAGQTTGAELLEKLKGLPDVDQQTIVITGKPWNIFDDQIFFSFRQNWALGQDPKIRGEVYLTDSIVSYLALCGKINTSLGEIVEAAGEPENIISGNNFYGGRTIILTLPSKGVSFSYTTELDKLEISPDTQIDCLRLFDPHLYEAMLEAKFFSNGYYNAEETLKAQYPWDGYGNLDEKYPPRQP